MVGNVAVDLYLGRNGIVWCYRSLLGSMLKKITLYWGRSGRVWRCLSLLETVW